jgi:PPP family 3-phenylpropionic acid transporter
MLYAAMMVVNIVMLQMMDLKIKRPQSPSWREMAKAVQGDMISFFVVVIAMGATLNVQSSFLFLYLQSLGSTTTLMGVSLFFSVILEIIFFFFARKIVRAMGLTRLLVLAIGLMSLRFAGYCFITKAWMVLPFETLHGIIFGAFWTAGIEYTRQHSPKGMEAAAQGVFSGLFLGSGALGTIFGGFVFGSLGPLALFGMCSVVNLLVAVGFALLHWRETMPSLFSFLTSFPFFSFLLPKSPPSPLSDPIISVSDDL